jgi:hypothetical protein
MKDHMAAFSKTQLLPEMHLSMQILSDVFGERIISSGIWRACSSDFNLFLFFLSSGVLSRTKFTIVTPERKKN